MEKKKTLIYLVLTNNGYWGKGKSLIEAMKNSRFQHHTSFVISIFLTDKPENISVDPYGGTHYNEDDVYIKDKTVYDRWSLVDFPGMGTLLDYLLDEYLKDDPKARKRINSILMDVNLSSETDNKFN